jgi:cytochrome c-type biogenesis protein CcmH
MILFWFVVAGMIILALAFLLSPLIRLSHGNGIQHREVILAVYRDRLAEIEADRKSGELDSDVYHVARLELERNLVEDLPQEVTPQKLGAGKKPAALAITLAAAVPLLSIGMYLELGAPAALTGNIPGSEQSQANMSPRSPAEMVASLEARLREKPDNPEGWFMLGRSLSVLDQPEKAHDAYRKAYELLPSEPAVIVGYAESIARLNNNRLVGEPETLLRAALRINPDFQKGLWLAGIAAFQRGDYEPALTLWERLYNSETLEPEERRLLDSFIASAKAKISPSPVTAKTNTESPLIARILVRVELDPKLREKTTPEDIVYVYARAVSGPPMPLAVAKLQVGDLPAELSLDDSMGIVPQIKLSQFNEVVVGARVSRSGSATATAGDLQGLSGSVNPASGEPVEVKIEEIIQ